MKGNVLREEEIKIAHDNAERTEISDYLFLRNAYFPCGFSREPYYNYNFAEIMAMIGKTYKTKKNAKNSNYHEGIAYIASNLEISKRKVKILRKKFKTWGGYQFKTPYEIADIVSLIIEVIIQNKSNKRWNGFFVKNNGKLYRDILIRAQKDEIDISAEACERIREIQSALNSLIEMCGK